MAPMYYRGSHVCILVYDISDRQSFEDVYSWLEELGRTVSKETLIFVVGMKTDLAAKRAIRSASISCLILMDSPAHRQLWRGSRHDKALAEATLTHCRPHSAVTARTRHLPPRHKPVPSRFCNVESRAGTVVFARRSGFPQHCRAPYLALARTSARSPYYAGSCTRRCQSSSRRSA